MYRFRKENWAKKVDSSFPKHWSKSNQEYGFFMEQPRHLSETQYYETHSDLIKRSPYTPAAIPRAHMSVIDTVPNQRMRKRRQRVGVDYDYDDKHDMWDVLKHRENPRAPHKILTRSPMRLPPLGRSKTRIWDTEPTPRLNTQWFRTAAPETAATRSQTPEYGYDYSRYPPGAADRSGAISRQRPSRVNTPAFNRETTMGLRLRTVGPREDHGIAAAGGVRPSRGGGGRGTAVPSEISYRGQDLTVERDPTGFFRPPRSSFEDQSNASTAGGRPKSRYGCSRPRTGKGRRETINERFFRFNFHPQWKPALRSWSQYFRELSCLIYNWNFLVSLNSSNRTPTWPNTVEQS